MFKGVAFALGACFIWGWIFVIPELMTGFSSIEVALGRYLVYGIISSVIFLRLILKRTHRHPKWVWGTALYFSLASTVVYYTFVVLALRYASPAICTLILGTCPITAAFYGNWKQKEVAFKSLILPSLLILIGLVIINVPHLQTATSPAGYVLGLLCSFCALIVWSWYVVANARFLKQHPKVCSSDWSTLIGVCTLFWVIAFSAILLLFFEDQLHMEKYLVFNHELANFLIGSALLGIFCSWIGAFLWNKASLHLPVSLAGQLTVFETIFGVLFVYLVVNKSAPSCVESIGMIVLLAAIFYGIRKFAKRKTYIDQIKPH